jgi:Domain of unknown function (DUF932)
MNANLNGHHAAHLFDTSKSAPGGVFDNLRGPDMKEPETLSELVEDFSLTASNHYPDIDVPVRALAMTAKDNIIVPDRGPCMMTAWAKKQLASRLGITWNRWFEGIDPGLRADEVNRRLARDEGTIRAKTTIGAGPEAESVATLRGFVSTSYATIPDSVVAQAVLEELRMGDPRIVRHTTTDRTTSYVVRIGAPFHVGGPAQVGDVVGGLIVRNSDVGYASLVIALHLTRLVCKNGMVVAENKTLIHRAHRRIDISDLTEKLALGLQDVPARLQRAGRALERSGHHSVDHIEAALVEVLRIARLPLRVLPALTAAYDREPHASAFGISQAVTLGAQDPRVSAEERVALEQAAGEYVARYAGQ